MEWNYLSIPKLQRLHRWSLEMDKWFHPTLYQRGDYSSMLGLKLNMLVKRGHWYADGLIQLISWCVSFLPLYGLDLVSFCV